MSQDIEDTLPSCLCPASKPLIPKELPFGTACGSPERDRLSRDDHFSVLHTGIPVEHEGLPDLFVRQGARVGECLCAIGHIHRVVPISHNVTVSFLSQHREGLSRSGLMMSLSGAPATDSPVPC